MFNSPLLSVVRGVGVTVVRLVVMRCRPVVGQPVVLEKQTPDVQGEAQSQESVGL